MPHTDRDTRREEEAKRRIDRILLANAERWLDECLEQIFEKGREYTNRSRNEIMELFEMAKDCIGEKIILEMNKRSLGVLNRMRRIFADWDLPKQWQDAPGGPSWAKKKRDSVLKEVDAKISKVKTLIEKQVSE